MSTAPTGQIVVIVRQRADTFIARAPGFPGSSSSTNQARFAALRHASKIHGVTEDRIYLTETKPGHYTAKVLSLLQIDLEAVFAGNAFPTGQIAAILCNDLKALIMSKESEWSEIEDAVRYLYTFVPSYKIEYWAKRLKKGGA